MAGYRAHFFENGVEVEAFVRDALFECLKFLKAGTKVRFWSGGDAVAPQTGLREGPLDGDAFHKCEAEVLSRHGPTAFVLAVYISSDSSVVSRSGGTFAVTLLLLLLKTLSVLATGGLYASLYLSCLRQVAGDESAVEGGCSQQPLTAGSLLWHSRV